MKITFDIDCTPAEARAFFGLPDLTPVHEIWLEKMKTMATEGIAPAEFERMARSWMPGISEGFDQWRQMFLGAAGLAKKPE